MVGEELGARPADGRRGRLQHRHNGGHCALRRAAEDAQPEGALRSHVGLGSNINLSIGDMADAVRSVALLKTLSRDAPCAASARS